MSEREGSIGTSSREGFKDRFPYALTMGVVNNYLINGVSVEELASQIGVSEYTLKRWMRGDAFPRSTSLEPLAEALDLPIEFLASPPPLPTYPFPRQSYEVSYGQTDANEVTVYPDFDMRVRLGDATSQRNLLVVLAPSSPVTLQLTEW